MKSKYIIKEIDNKIIIALFLSHLFISSYFRHKFKNLLCSKKKFNLFLV